MGVKNKSTEKKLDILTWVIFVFSLGVVLITLTSAIFPALVLGAMDEFPKHPMKINIYELGILAYPVLITNFVLVALVILYLKNKLPAILTKSIKFALNFEVSTKVAFLVVIILLGLYITFTIGEILQGEPWPDYTRNVKPRLEEWSIQEFIHINDRPIVYFFGTISMDVFGNYKVIPFITSISLLVLTYFITAEISKKKFAGIISLTVILSSTIFLTYDSTITYPNFWIFFYLLSLFTIYKAWPFSAISFTLAVLSKALPVFFLPMTFFFIYRSKLSRKKKLRITISYVIILSAGVLVLSFEGMNFFNIFTFDNHEFWSGFTSISYQFRFDGLIIVFLLPLIVGLFISSRSGVKGAESVMVLILGILLLAPIIPGFTTNTNNPYRFIPLIIFFAMGVGILFSKRVNQPAAAPSNEL